MKRLFVAISILATICTANAQDRTIVMPSQPQKSHNIAEDGNGTFWCGIEIGGGTTLMEGRKNVAMLGGAFTAGYRFNQYLKVGVGMGGLYYPNSGDVRTAKTHIALPVFFNTRGNILSDEIRHTVPYWSVNIGTSIPDGFFMTPSVGLRIGEKRNAFVISLGYTLRHLKSHPECISDYSGTLLKLGYEF